MYNRQSVDIDIHYYLNTTNDANEAECPFHTETFDTMLPVTLSLG